ncbi:hypothetical protein [Prescottella equi]
MSLSSIIDNLTGAQLDEVETILGVPYIDAPPVKLARVVGYIRRKREQGSTDTWDEYNQLSVREQIAASGYLEDEDDEGKDEPAGRHASVDTKPIG